MIIRGTYHIALTMMQILQIKINKRFKITIITYLCQK